MEATIFKQVPKSSDVNINIDKIDLSKQEGDKIDFSRSYNSLKHYFNSVLNSKEEFDQVMEEYYFDIDLYAMSDEQFEKYSKKLLARGNPYTENNIDVIELLREMNRIRKTFFTKDEVRELLIKIINKINASKLGNEFDEFLSILSIDIDKNLLIIYKGVIIKQDILNSKFKVAYNKLNELRYSIVELYNKLKSASLSEPKIVAIFAGLGITLLVLSAGTLVIFTIDKKRYKSIEEDEKNNNS